MPISATGQSLDSFYVTESPLSVTNIAEMAMFYLKLTSLEDFPLEDGPISPTGQFKQSLDKSKNNQRPHNPDHHAIPSS